MPDGVVRIVVSTDDDQMIMRDAVVINKDHVCKSLTFNAVNISTGLFSDDVTIKVRIDFDPPVKPVPDDAKLTDAS